jgi:hypothetical protein
MDKSDGLSARIEDPFGSHQQTSPLAVRSACGHDGGTREEFFESREGTIHGFHDAGLSRFQWSWLKAKGIETETLTKPVSHSANLVRAGNWASEVKTWYERRGPYPDLRARRSPRKMRIAREVEASEDATADQAPDSWDSHTLFRLS